MRAAGAVLDTEAQNVVAELAERRGRRRASEASADDEDGVFPLVGGVDQLHLELVPVPLPIDWTGGNLGVERHACTRPVWVRYTHAAIRMKPAAINTAVTLPATSSFGVTAG